jgi:hypothetical protein
VLQALKVNDTPRREAFAQEMLLRQDNDDGYRRKILFSDETIFHVSGKESRHNVTTWGSENQHHATEHIRGSPEVHVWCGLMLNRIIEPFFFAESAVTKEMYLAMLQQFVVPQVEDLQPTVLLQQDGASTHWGRIVRDYLDATLPNRWLGTDGPLAWPPQSSDITTLDFFLCGYAKDKVYATKVTGVEDLMTRIREVITAINRCMLARTWEEFEFRVDVLRATQGTHIDVR